MPLFDSENCRRITILFLEGGGLDIPYWQHNPFSFDQKLEDAYCLARYEVHGWGQSGCSPIDKFTRVCQKFFEGDNWKQTAVGILGWTCYVEVDSSFQKNFGWTWKRCGTGYRRTQIQIDKVRLQTIFKHLLKRLADAYKPPDRQNYWGPICHEFGENSIRLLEKAEMETNVEVWQENYALEKAVMRRLKKLAMFFGMKPIICIIKTDIKDLSAKSIDLDTLQDLDEVGRDPQLPPFVFLTPTAGWLGDDAFILKKIREAEGYDMANEIEVYFSTTIFGEADAQEALAKKISNLTFNDFISIRNRITTLIQPRKSGGSNTPEIWDTMPIFNGV